MKLVLVIVDDFDQNAALKVVTPLVSAFPLGAEVDH